MDQDHTTCISISTSARTHVSHRSSCDLPSQFFGGSSCRPPPYTVGFSASDDHRFVLSFTNVTIPTGLHTSTKPHPGPPRAKTITFIIHSIALCTFVCLCLCPCPCILALPVCVCVYYTSSPAIILQAHYSNAFIAF
jgi:hypothetical protein